MRRGRSKPTTASRCASPKAGPRQRDTPPGFAHPDCYARAFGGCSRQMSGEHYISKGILELVENRVGQKSKSVRAVGLAFQKPGVEQQFGVTSLVGNILCETHNSLLSP